MNQRAVFAAAILLSMAAFGTSGVAPPTAPRAVADSSEAKVAATAPGGPAEDLLARYNEFMLRHGDLVAPQPGAPPTDARLALLEKLMAELYPTAAAAGVDAHKTVALLISQGLSEAATSAAFNKTFKEKQYQHRQISDAMSMAMSEARDVLIEQSILAVARQEGWMIGRSDSGNPKSGMRSDLDQTFFVFRVDPETGAAVRDESLDMEFIQKFEQHWAANRGELGLKLLDVVSIGGKNRFPDPRSTAVHVDFQRAYHSTLAELRNTPGAYTTYGAVMQQVQRRMMETLDALRNPETAGLWREKGRIWQEYGPDRDQPGRWSKNPKPDFSLAARTMFFAPADLLPDSALGAAVANFLELQHYMHRPKFNTKYHLRTFDDALFSLHLIEQGRGLKDKIDYSSMSVEKRRAVGRDLLGRVFAGDASKQRQHLLALEISCDLRLEHTSEKPADFMRVEAYKRHGSVPPDPDARAGLIYAELARELYGAAFTPADPDPLARARTREQIQASEQHYRRLASELCLEAVNRTAGDALAFFNDPTRAESLFERSRPLLEKSSPSGVDWDATKQNVAESARITLLYAVYDLGAIGGARMLQRLGAEAGAKNVDLVRIYLKGQFAPLSAFRANPEAYLRTWRRETGILAERVWQQGLSELGFVELGKARYTIDLLGRQKLVWSPFTYADKWADAALWDKGSFASLAEVARAYFHSKGDIEPIAAAIMMELLGAMPVVGQVVAVTQGGLEGAVKVVVALSSPTGATALVVYQIGDAAYAIYEVEVGAPSRGNVVDALYRGFAGPESVAYGEPGKPPPAWTADDEAALAELQKNLRAARPSAPPGAVEAMSPSQLEAYLEEYAARVESYRAVAAATEPKIQALQQKQAEFAQYRDGYWAGGYMTGFSRVEDQRWLSMSLLDPVPLVTAFVTSGVVDLRTPFVPGRDDARIAELRAKAASNDDIEARLDAAAALFELERQKEQWERAKRYEKHALEKNRELLHRFKRDSVFRWVQENGIDMNAYVDGFVERHGEALAKELHKLELHYPFTTSRGRIRGEPFGENRVIYSINAFKDALKERLAEDYERSRRLTAYYKTFERDRVARCAENLANSKAAFRNQMLGMAVGVLGEDADHQRALAALRASAIRRAAPEVRVTFNKVSLNPGAARGGPAGQPLPEVAPCEIGVSADVIADETIYFGPYDVKAAFLRSEELDRPGDWTAGIPITEGVRATIAALRARHGEALGRGHGVIGVASVVASGMADLAGALPATVAHLPGRDWRSAEGKVLIGQQAAFIPFDPLEVRADPIRVVVKDAAGSLITGKDGLVSIGDAPARVTDAEYWGAHRFTKFGESVSIVATATLPGGREVVATKPLAIADLENWLVPQAPPPVLLELPAFLPGAFECVGKIVLRGVAGAADRGRCRIRSSALGIDAEVEILANAGGTFRLPVAVLVARDATVELTATATAGGRRSDGRASRSVPPRPGTIDFGTITLEVQDDLVVIPEWDRDNPPTLKQYRARLAALDLTAHAEIRERAPRRGFDHRVSGTEPGPGQRVPKQSGVMVYLFSRFAAVMPDVRGRPLAEAVAEIEALGVHVTSTLGPAPPRPELALTVVEQSKGHGDPVEPGETVALVAHTRFAAAPDPPRPDPPRPPPPRPDPAPPRRPYYASFAVTMPEFTDSTSARVPKKGRGETDEQHWARKRDFVTALREPDFKWKDHPTSETVLTFHVSGAAIDKYPAGFFRPGERYTCRLHAGGDVRGRPAVIRGAVLLTFQQFFDRLDDVTAAYPASKKQKEFQAIAFTRADGVTEVGAAQGAPGTTWGPVTAGWTDANRRDAIELVKAIYILIDCFVATTIYGDDAAPEVQRWREFRDRALLRTDAGRRFASLYQRSGPRWARFVAERPLVRRGLRVVLDAGARAIERVDLGHPLVIRTAGLAAEAGLWALGRTAPANGDDWNVIILDLVGRPTTRGANR